MTKSMTTRIVSAAVAIVIAVVVLLLHNTFIFDLAIALLAAGAVYELFKAMDYLKYKIQSAVCIGYAFFECVSFIWLSKTKLLFLNELFFVGVLILSMCLLFLKNHEEFKFGDFFLMIAVAFFVPYSFTTLLNMNLYGGVGLFMVILTLCGAWLADSGAYFAGTFFGKTPLCPSISPKKTVEGVLGGILTNGLIFIIIGLFYEFALDGSPIHYVPLFLTGMICALIGLVGDLTASVIKRQCGIKDYGNIMPGHGGIMDRFDSVLLVAPFMFYVFTQGWII
ncbi:MAG: phosphatidate cytidylyltransferase [Oscillospiraceae bacterium]